MSVIKEKATKRVRKRPVKVAKKSTKPCTKLHLQENPPDVERIASVLAAPEYSTRAKQAKALGVCARTLQYWLSGRPEILRRALELAREASAATMITGYRRLDGIIAKGKVKNCLDGIKLLAQLRGELTDKHEVAGAGGGPLEITVNVAPPNDK